MASIRVSADELGSVVATRLRKTMASPLASRIVADRAKRRIRRGGDSEIRYPELWSRKTGVGYRWNGKPLRDTGNLFNSLTGKGRVWGGNRVSWLLMDGTPGAYASKHQEGFTNTAPIAIPLNQKAKKMIDAQSTEPPHNIEALEDSGLRRAPTLDAASRYGGSWRKYDFAVLYNDSEVPARPIFNLPKEDIKAYKGHVRKMIQMAMGA